MCFSATASLVAGGALAAIGVATIAQAKSKRELPLASIPLLFGFQQLVDGVVWLTPSAPALHEAAVYTYATFAAVVWPIFVPLAILSVEKVKARREALTALSLMGLGLGAYLLYFIVSGTVIAPVVNHCIAYGSQHKFGFGPLAFYLVAACGPFFVAKDKFLNLLGGVLLVSFAIAWWFYIETFPSVWCFFAAIISTLLYWYFRSR